MNTLYYGDNLQILREHIKDESVDPPTRCAVIGVERWVVKKAAVTSSVG